MTIKEVAAKGFVSKQTYDVILRGTTRPYFYINKSRPYDEKGVMKSVKPLEITLDMTDAKAILKMHKAKNPTSKDEAYWKDVFQYLIDNNILDKKMTYGVFQSEIDGGRIIIPKGYVIDHFSSSGYAPEYKFLVFPIDTFVEINKTKKELASIQRKEERNQTEKLNALVIKDNLLDILNKNGYTVVLSKSWKDDGAYITFDHRKGFNKLCKEAIEYYLNNIVLKELGCEIEVPKVATNHRFGPDDVLCYLGDVKLNLEQKGE